MLHLLPGWTAGVWCVWSPGFQHLEQFTYNKKPSAILFTLSVSSDLSSAVYNPSPQEDSSSHHRGVFPQWPKKCLELGVDNCIHLLMQTVPFAPYLPLSRGKCCHKSCLSRRQNVLGDHSETVKWISWDIRTVTNLTFQLKFKAYLFDF